MTYNISREVADVPSIGYPRSYRGCGHYAAAIRDGEIIALQAFRCANDDCESCSSSSPEVAEALAAVARPGATVLYGEGSCYQFIPADELGGAQ